MPKMRMPGFLVDLFYDLDERHLLPVVAILVIGIIAIPLLLGGSSSSDNGSASVEASATASAALGPEPSTLVVAKATPGLRDYKRRLGHLHPTNPFKPRYTEKSSNATAAASSTETTESTSTTESSPAPVESSGGASPATTPSSTKHKVTFFSYAIDVKITPVSSGNDKSDKPETTVRHDLPPLVMLPSRDTPALTYIGPSRDGKKAMMVVSSDVTSLFGDSKCVLGSQTCQMLALEPGLPETVVFGANARTYEIELLKLQIVTSSHLNRAALGKPKPKHGKSGKSN